MNFKQLEAFLAFMATGSTIAAAQRLGASQPAVSRLLSQFESDLGLPLFVRRKGRLLPSNEAAALLPDVRNMLLDAESLQRHVGQLRRGGVRRSLLRVLLPGSVAQCVMPSVVEPFLNDHGGVALEMQVGNSEAGEAAVLGREADLALVRSPTQHAGLQTILRLDTDAVCIMPAGHALEALPQVEPGDLIGVDMVLLGRQRALRQQVDQVLRQGRTVPRIRAEAHTMELACRLVACGVGVSIVNGLYARLCHGPEIVCRPFVPRIGCSLDVITLASQPRHPLVLELSRRIVDAMSRLAGSEAFAAVEP